MQSSFEDCAVEAAKRWRFAWADDDTLKNWRRMSVRFLFLPPKHELGPGRHAGCLVYEDDGKGVDFASVIVIGTRIGTYTDSMGRFLLEGLGTGSRELQVNCITCAKTKVEVDLASSDLGIIRIARRTPHLIE